MMLAMNTFGHDYLGYLLLLVMVISMFGLYHTVCINKQENRYINMNSHEKYENSSAEESNLNRNILDSSKDIRNEDIPTTNNDDHSKELKTDNKIIDKTKHFNVILFSSIRSSFLCILCLRIACAFGSALAAFILRRHLMVWAIFAPKVCYDDSLITILI